MSLNQSNDTPEEAPEGQGHLPQAEQRWMLRVGLAILVLVPTTLALLNYSAPVISVVTVACAAAVLLLRLPDLQTFSLGPLKGELRREITIARATIKQLNDVAATLSGAMLGQLMAANRWNYHADRHRRFIERDRVLDKLREAGLSEENIKVANADFDAWVAFDLSLAIRSEVSRELREDPDRATALTKRLDTLRSGYTLVVGTAAEHRALIEEAVPISDPIAEALADLEHFEKHRKLRRPGVYFN